MAKKQQKMTAEQLKSFNPQQWLQKLLALASLAPDAFALIEKLLELFAARQQKMEAVQAVKCEPCCDHIDKAIEHGTAELVELVCARKCCSEDAYG